MSPLRIVNRIPQEALRHYLKKHQLSLPHDFTHDVLQLLIGGIMEIEVSELIEASRYERNTSRRAYRNGYRETVWQNITIRIPKLRSGTYYPDFLQAAENLLCDVVRQLYLNPADDTPLANVLKQLGVDAQPYQIAELHEQLYDLAQRHRKKIIIAKTIHLDLVPVNDKGRQRYLAIAFDDEEILAPDITTHVDDEFWQDFIRRLDGRAVGHVEYIAVSQLYHVITLSKSSTPQNLLAVA